MESLILAGGKGTRLISEVPNTPKALAPINGIPFIEILLKQISKHKKISKCIFLTGVMSEQIRDHVNKYPSLIPTQFSHEESPLGTGGAIRNALPQIESDTFLALNGDSYIDIDISDLIQFHKHMNAGVTIVSAHVKKEHRYGFLNIDKNKRVLSFCEKSDINMDGWINAGIYVIQKELFSSFTNNMHKFSLEIDFLSKLKHENVFAYQSKKKFIDIGTPESYRKSGEFFKHK